MPPIRSLYVKEPPTQPTMGPVTTLQRLRDLYTDTLKDFIPADIVKALLPSQDVTMPLTTVLPAGAAGEFADQQLAEPVKRTLKAYHGSPHDFDQFSLGKIGTGEGAQAYGHGLYFAENEGVAQDYRKKLSKFGSASEMPEDLAKSIEFDGKVIDGSTPSNQLTPLERAALAKHYAGGIQQRAIDEAERDLKYLTPGTPAYEMDKATLDALKTNDLTGRIKPIYGRTYEVNIHASPDELLDWDKPLSQQPPKVQEAVRGTLADFRKRVSVVPSQNNKNNWLIKVDSQVVGASNTEAQAWKNANEMIGDLSSPEFTGREAYHALARAHSKQGAFPEIGVPNPPMASGVLEKSGIKGIQYLDQGSRGKTRWIATHPQGGINDFADEASARAFVDRNPEYSLKGPDITKNFVIFDDKIIEIAKKYGLSLPVAASLYKWQQSQKGVE